MNVDKTHQLIGVADFPSHHILAILEKNSQEQLLNGIFFRETQSLLKVLLKVGTLIQAYYVEEPIVEVAIKMLEAQGQSLAARPALTACSYSEKKLAVKTSSSSKRTWSRSSRGR